jgi:hypothetical protein
MAKFHYCVPEGVIIQMDPHQKYENRNRMFHALSRVMMVAGALRSPVTWLRHSTVGLEMTETREKKAK